MNDNFFNVSVSEFDVKIPDNIPNIITDLNTALKALSLNKLINKDLVFKLVDSPEPINLNYLYAQTDDDIKKVIDLILTSESYIKIFDTVQILAPYLDKNENYNNILAKLPDNKPFSLDLVKTLLPKIKPKDFENILDHDTYLVGDHLNYLLFDNYPKPNFCDIVINACDIVTFLEKVIAFANRVSYSEVIIFNKVTLNVSEQYLERLLNIVLTDDIKNNINNLKYKELFYKAYVDYKCTINAKIRSEKNYDNDISNKYFDFCNIKYFTVNIYEGKPLITENISFLIRNSNCNYFITRTDNIISYLRKYKFSHERTFMNSNSTLFIPSAFVAHKTKVCTAPQQYDTNHPYHTLEQGITKLKSYNFSI